MLSQPRVIFGPEIWSLQNEGGISRYFQQLIQGLSEKGVGGKVLTMNNSNTRIRNLRTLEFQIQTLKGERNVHKEISTVLEQEINRNIFHPTYFSKHLADYRSPSTRIIVTVHDMISELFPEKGPRLRKKSNLKKSSIRDADHILCVSMHTKNDLMDLYGTPAEKISVTYLGSNLHLLPIRKEPTALKNEYILYVGKRSGYKNFHNFVAAYSHSKLLTKSFSIVVVGGGEFTSDENQELRNLGIFEKVIHVESDDALLAMYYRNAACLVYPSLYEGFGLPPVEAMSLNCPVIASSAGSIPEICKGAAEYFDPTNIDSIEHAMTHTLQNSNRIFQMRQSGLLISELYTWEKTVLNTLNAYKCLT